MDHMKAMVLTGIRQIGIINKLVPELVRPDEVLIRMKSVGICGSDIHYYREGKIGSQVVKYPFTIGHEGAGIVEKTGSAVERLKPGDRVAIDPAMPCYECEQCMQKRFHTCRKLKFLGCPGQAEGCFSEFIVMPEKSCIPIHENMTYDQAALSEPLAIGMYAVHLAQPVKGKKIGILGSGPIGVSVMLSARALGCEKIYMTDKLDRRLALASETGATWTGNPDTSDIIGDILKNEAKGLDIVFECCGQQEAVDQAVSLLKPGGVLLIVGIPSFKRWSFDVDDLRRKEITVQNVRRQNKMAEKTVEMIASGKIIPDRMQTHTYDFEQIREAFDLVDNYRDGVMKAMIRFGK
jgi:L-iditol 2-dehydrogenase